MRLRLLALAGSLVVSACAFDSVQGSAAGESASSSGSESSSSTTTPDPTTSGGAACLPGMSVACTCPNSQEGAQECNPDGKSFGPCMCEGGTDSEGGTTTTTGPDTTTTTTDVDTTDATAAATGPGTTTGSMCADPGPEPNNLESEAVDLGDQQCDADAETLMGVLDGAGDVDWFVYHGVYMDCGILPPDPEATQVLTAAATVRLCVFPECDMGTVEFECDDGETMSLSPEGRPGCCNQGDVVFSLNCLNSDEHARLFIRVDQGPADACTDYSVAYSYVAE